MLNKMNTIIARIAGLLLLLTLFFAFAGTSFAASTDVSIRLSQPKSPTNKDSFNITFVTLDTQNRAITVKCLKKGPSDGPFSQFGSDISVSPGGNTGNCSVNSSIVNTQGTYQFEAQAFAGADSAISPIVSVDFNTSGPGAPTNFSKDRPTSCQYKIKFRTADDGGKTVKARLYRADSTSSDPTSTSEVAAVNIGSNTDGEFTDTVPDCTKNYYYAVRAFDSAGNASGVVGDSINIGTTTTTTTAQQQGAIPVGGTGGGQVLGTGTEAGKTGEALGEATKSAKPSTAPSKPSEVAQKPVATSANWVLTHKKISLLVLLLLSGVGYYLYRRFRKS